MCGGENDPSDPFAYITTGITMISKTVNTTGINKLLTPKRVDACCKLDREWQEANSAILDSGIGKHIGFA